MNSGNKRPVSIDDLLRLKRAERPPQGFWTEFDRQLRAKQLAALVEKRPWWQTMPSLAVLWPRVRVPLGVATVVGLGILSFQSDRIPVTEMAPTVAETSQPAIDLPRPAKPAGNLMAAAAPEIVPHEPVTPAALVAELPAKASADIVVPPASSRVVVVSDVGVTLQSGRDRGLVGQPLVATSVTESRAAVSSSRPPVDPLQQMTPPGESRRARFLTAMVSTASVETSARISERVASRFAEDRLQDQAGRFGARGDRVNLKF
ncbi:MAG: hypothetical protein JNL39_15775 [Opitutaceae bacterium]|nr:hypothetical protein [Opitutaceae bacterium]